MFIQFKKSHQIIRFTDQFSNNIQVINTGVPQHSQNIETVDWGRGHIQTKIHEIITFSEHIKYIISSINNKIYFYFLVSCFHVFLSHIIIITFEQCAELTVAITITHRNVTDTACRKCKLRCSLQLNCMKQIMKWLLETLIFIKISPQSVYGKYFIIKNSFLQTLPSQIR